MDNNYIVIHHDDAQQDSWFQQPPRVLFPGRDVIQWIIFLLLAEQRVSKSHAPGSDVMIELLLMLGKIKTKLSWERWAFSSSSLDDGRPWLDPS